MQEALISLKPGESLTITGRYGNELNCYQVGKGYFIEIWESPPGQDSLLKPFHLGTPLGKDEVTIAIGSFLNLIIERNSSSIINHYEWKEGVLPSKLKNSGSDCHDAMQSFMNDLDPAIKKRIELERQFCLEEEINNIGSPSISMDYTRGIMRFSYDESYGYRSVSDIVYLAIEIDDKTFSETSSGSMVARAAVGAIIFGGVGALVGGVTARKENKREVNKISLKIAFREKPALFHDICLYSKSSLFGGYPIEIAEEKVKRIHSYIDQRITQSSAAQGQNNSSSSS